MVVFENSPHYIFIFVYQVSCYKNATYYIATKLHIHGTIVLLANLLFHWMVLRWFQRVCSCAATNFSLPKNFTGLTDVLTHMRSWLGCIGVASYISSLSKLAKACLHMKKRNRDEMETHKPVLSPCSCHLCWYFIGWNKSHDWVPEQRVKCYSYLRPKIKDQRKVKKIEAFPPPLHMQLNYT